MTKVQFWLVSVLMIVIALLQLPPLLPGNRFAPKYEYVIKAIPDVQFADKMNQLGAQGWDLVFARRAMGDEKEMAYEAIFKRPM